MSVRALIFIACLVAAVPVFPCSIVVVPHELDAAEQQVDRIPPERVTAAVKGITRGRGPVSHGDGITAVSSCDDLGSVTMRVSTTDDRTPAEKLGYVALHWSGSMPAGLLDRLEVRRIGENGEYSLWWPDGATDTQEPLEFALLIVAVDLAGNRSVPSEPLWIRHPGSAPAADSASCH